MTEDEYISRLRAGWPQGSDASSHVIALADEAVRALPQSARLWVMRGDLIQLGPESCPQPLAEALASYQRAVQIAPDCSEAWEEIGHYYDVVLNDEEGARPYFERAASLKGRPAASLKGGPATQLGDSGVVGGPPTVS
jgi:hypothetical protein